MALAQLNRTVIIAQDEEGGLASAKPIYQV